VGIQLRGGATEVSRRGLVALAMASLAHRPGARWRDQGRLVAEGGSLPTVLCACRGRRPLVHWIGDGSSFVGQFVDVDAGGRSGTGRAGSYEDDPGNDRHVAVARQGSATSAGAVMAGPQHVKIPLLDCKRARL
jgi:hypothetical protein